jgi:competence protein ComEA
MISAILLLALVLSVVPAGALANAGAASPDQGPPSAEQDQRININEAGPEELVRLPGVGPARAQAIVAEREKRRFRRIEDILRVPGIGRKTFDRLRQSIRVR